MHGLSEWVVSNKEFPELLEAAGTAHQSLPQLTGMNIEKTQCDQGQFNSGD